MLANNAASLDEPSRRRGTQKADCSVVRGLHGGLAKEPEVQPLTDEQPGALARRCSAMKMLSLCNEG